MIQHSHHHPYNGEGDRPESSRRQQHESLLDAARPAPAHVILEPGSGAEVGVDEPKTFPGRRQNTAVGLNTDRDHHDPRDPNSSRKVNFDYSRVTFDPSRSISRSESAQYSLCGSVVGDAPERRNLTSSDQRELLSLLQRMDIAAGPDDEPSKPPAINVRKTKSLDEHRERERDARKLIPVINQRTGPQPQATSTSWEQGFISRKQGILARWQRRLYVLDNVYLRKRTKKSMREVFCVRDVLEIRPQVGGSRPNVCCVILASSHGSGRSIKLAFDSQQDMNLFTDSVLARRKATATAAAAAYGGPVTAR
eukprot:tig00020902_g14954.t1